MHTRTDETPVYGIRPTKPGMYLGLFHGRETPMQVMDEWGFDSPAIGPIKYVHTTYACTIHVQFESPIDAKLLTGSQDVYLEIQINGDLLYFDGKQYGDWTVYSVAPEECFRPPDTFRQNVRPNEWRKQARPVPIKD